VRAVTSYGHNAAMVIALLLLAAALEITGLWLAAVGFKRTWREHAPGQDFWQPMKARARSTRQGAVRRIRQMIGRPAPAHVTLGTATIALSAVALDARGRVTWGPLPDPSDQPALVAELHQRINDLHAALQQAQHDLIDERNARETGDEAAHTAMRAEVETVVHSTQRVAVGGLRLQVAGWLLVLAGIIVGTIANIMQV
jgi:hypothetical protein